MDTSLETDIVKILTERGQTIGTAESCTGGLVAHRLTNIPGSSACVWGGIVAYANQIKEQVTGVRHDTLVNHGAVSAETAAELAQGARRLLRVDVAVSVTGIAGPGGGSEGKPVGLTYVWTGDRVANKEQSADAALHMVLDYLIPGRSTSRYTPGDNVSDVDADILPDGRVTPRAFVLQGERHLVAGIGRQWIEGDQRHVLVNTNTGDTFELAVLMPAMVWTGKVVSRRAKMA
jgi:PncC family amidohydrolase